jgi:phosphatidylserine synthase
MRVRWRVGSVGVKDLFTLVNLLSGVIAVHFVLQDRLHAAGYAVIAGYLFGDLLDGLVARATMTANRFGAELDTVADHFVHVVVPGLVLYDVYDLAGHQLQGVVALGILIASSSIRHARFAAAKFDYRQCWCGLPRTITGFSALSFPLSRMFANIPNRYTIGVLVIAALSAMSLLPIPYMTHRGERAMQLWVKAGVAIFVISLPVSFLFSRQYLFDVFFICTTAYAIGGWIPVRRQERKAFYAEYRRWSAELAGSHAAGVSERS